MHGHAAFAARKHDGHIGRYDRINARSDGCVDQAFHLPDFFIVNNGVDGEIPFFPRPVNDPHDFGDFFGHEVSCGVRPHVKPPHTEIDAVGASGNGSG